MADQGEGSSSRQPRRGRQKVAMVKMENESNLQVTFSKRRTGLFKKASELCTLCGVDVALIVFSPGKKVFSFGHPSVEAVIDCLAGVPENPIANQLIESHRGAMLRDLNAQLTQVTGQVDAERKRGESMKRQRRASMVHFWWEAPVEHIEEERKLAELHRAYLELKAAVAIRSDNLVTSAPANTQIAPEPHFFNINNNNNHHLGFGPVDQAGPSNPGPMNNNNNNHINNPYNLAVNPFNPFNNPRFY